MPTKLALNVERNPYRKLQTQITSTSNSVCYLAIIECDCQRRVFEFLVRCHNRHTKDRQQKIKKTNFQFQKKLKVKS